MINNVLWVCREREIAQDNAPTESFFGTLKKECVLTRTFQTRKEAQKTIEDYILNFYNQERLHSSLDYLSPVQYELLSC